MLFRFYVYNEKIIVPTVAETEEGFYVDTKPVSIYSVADMNEWKRVIFLALSRGNERIPTPDASDDRGSVLLEALNLQKWTTFEMRAVMYTIHGAASYIRVYRTGKGNDNMWDAARTNERTFDSRAPWSSIAHELAMDVIKQPEAHPVKSGGLMIIPKNPT